MTVDTEGKSRQSSISTGEVELLEFLAQRRACDDRDREIVFRRQSISARNQECVAGGNSVVASARLVVGKVTPLPRACTAFTSRRQFVDNLQTTNDLSRRGLE
jgi:hypothetical protein